MLFDFEKFSDITASVYPGGAYSLEDPPIKASQIVRICQDMPYIDRECSGGRYADIEPEDYPVLIDKYFATRYRGCDRNINHFFSGRIRELKFYEELY